MGTPASETVTETVQAIRRYPVKSMSGDALRKVDVTPRGLAGGRAYALVEKATNRAAVVRLGDFGKLPCAGVYADVV